MIDSYGTTETFGASGQVCEANHIHFHPSHALAEVIDLESRQPARPNCPGTLVITPLPPFRETTLLLRYDTEDMVVALPSPTACELRALPAVGHVLGGRSRVVRHTAGSVFPRDVQEVLERIEDVPLPARFGMWPVGDGVDVEVVVRSEAAVSRRQIVTALEGAGVPLRGLHLRTHPAELRCALPLRCDVRSAGSCALPARPATHPA